MKTIYRSIPRALCLAAILAVPVSGVAVAAQPVPPSATIDRLQEQRDRAEQFGPLPAPAMPAIKRPVVSPQAMPDNADQIMFLLKTIRLEGVTVYEQAAFQSLWKDDTGQVIPLTRLYQIADEITKRYRADGYILSRAIIPAQEIGDGVPTIRVVEGRVSDVRLEGDFSGTRLAQAAMARLNTGRPLNIFELERRVLLLDDLPGANFKVLLQPGEGDGNVVASLIGESTPAIISQISVDNSSSRYLGPYNATASAEITTDQLPFHKTHLVMGTSLPVGEVNLLAIEHSLPLTSDGVNLVLNVSRAEGKPGYTLKSNHIDGISTVFGARVNWYAIRQRTQSLLLEAGLSAGESRTKILGQPFTDDKIRTASLAGIYDWSDDNGNSNSLNLSVTKGLGTVFGGSQNGDIDLSRADGKSDFTKVNFSYSRTQYLNESFSLMGNLSGQLSNSPLLSSEEFGYGGQAVGRAYDPSEITGDSGVALLMELRHRGFALTPKTVIQPFFFYDIGKVWNRDTGSGTGQSGASAGPGLRFSAPHDFTASIMFAKPLTRPVAAPQYGHGKSPRFVFVLSKIF